MSRMRRGKDISYIYRTDGMLGSKVSLVFPKKEFQHNTAPKMRPCVFLEKKRKVASRLKKWQFTHEN